MKNFYGKPGCLLKLKNEKSCHFHVIFHALKILFVSPPPNIQEFENAKYSFTNECTKEFCQIDSKMEWERISWNKIHAISKK